MTSQKLKKDTGVQIQHATKKLPPENLDEITSRYITPQRYVVEIGTNLRTMHTTVIDIKSINCCITALVN